MKRVFPLLKYIIPVFILFLLVGLFGMSQISKEENKPQEKESSVTKLEYQDFHLLIPKLNISVPIIPDVDGNNKEAYNKALEGGVAQYKNTAKPGEGGNIFIFGHSSYYWWAPGDYKDIFKPLGDLQEGDEIVVWYEEKEYKYKVTEIKEVEPTDVSVLNPTSSEQLTIMTCWPPGTTEKRLIVIAKPE